VSANRWKCARRPLDRYPRDEDSLAMFFLRRGPHGWWPEGIGCTGRSGFPTSFPTDETHPMMRPLRQPLSHRRQQLCAFVLVGISILLVRPVRASADEATTAKTGDAWAAAPMDWPNWRGPELNGVSREKGLVDRWSPEGENVLWKRTDLGGRSTPICLHAGQALHARP